MRKQTKKLALTLLLSAALVSANMQIVSAEEESLSDTSEVSDDKSSDESDSSNDAGEGKSGSEADHEDDTSGTEDSGQSEDSGGTEDTSQSENTDQTDTGSDSTDGGSAPSEETQSPAVKDDNVSDEGGSGAGQEDGTEQDVQNPDTVTGEDGAEAGDTAADSTESGQPEQSFVNKNGDEVIPSDLVGVDYNEIADSYDGETNAVKQYVVSDEVPAGTIINSYVDENGNLVMVISQGAPESTLEEEKKESEEKTALQEVVETVEQGLDSVFGKNESAPAVDGSFTGWDDIPPSYEFNWNKPDAWVDGTHYTETNSTDVRHEMKLYSDGENVYLRVIFAREFCNGQVANGNDYQFWIDDQQMAAYQVQWPDGSQLSYNSGEPGVYMVEVRHRDSSWSYVLTDGAVAYYRVNENNLNNELELKIPLSEFVKQNGNINLDNYNMISFFTPNLMQNKISTAGASTGAEPFAAAAFLLVPTSCVLIKKKNDKEGYGIA